MSIKPDALTSWLSEGEIEKTKAELDSSATGEILYIATILRVMAADTDDFADDLRADGATLRAEDADGRAAQYRDAYAAILKIFNR